MNANTGATTRADGYSSGDLPIGNTKHEQAIAQWLLLGAILYALSLFSPLSNKAVNNCFYAGVMLPTLLLTRLPDLRALLASRLTLVSIAYLAYCAGAWAIAGEFDKLKYPIYILCLPLALYQLQRRHMLKPQVLAHLLFATAVLSTGGNLLAFYLKMDFLPDRPFIIGWQIAAPSFAMSYLAVCFAASAAYLIQNNRLVMLFAATFTTCAIMYLFNTRMGFAGLATAALAYVVMEIVAKGRLKQWRYVISILLPVCVVVLLYMQDALDPLLQRGSNQRFYIWQLLWQQLQDCSLTLGCGYDTDLSRIPIQPTPVLHLPQFMHHPHSIYMAQLFYSGALGLALLTAAIASGIYYGYATRSPWTYPFITGCGCLLVDGWGLLQSPHQYAWLLFWIPFAMLQTQTLVPKDKPAIPANAT